MKTGYEKLSIKQRLELARRSPAAWRSLVVTHVILKDDRALAKAYRLEHLLPKRTKAQAEETSILDQLLAAIALLDDNEKASLLEFLEREVGERESMPADAGIAALARAWFARAPGLKRIALEKARPKLVEQLRRAAGISTVRRA